MRIWITDVILEISFIHFEVFKGDKFCINKVYPFCSYIFSSNDKLLKKYQSMHMSSCDLFNHTHFRYLKTLIQNMNTMYVIFVHTVKLRLLSSGI